MLGTNLTRGAPECLQRRAMAGKKCIRLERAHLATFHDHFRPDDALPSSIKLWSSSLKQHLHDAAHLGRLLAACAAAGFGLTAACKK